MTFGTTKLGVKMASDGKSEAKDAVAADPEWTGTYIPRVRGLLVAQTTYLMNATEFRPAPD